MTDFTNNQGDGALPLEPGSDVNARILRTMVITVLLSSMISAVFTPWRVTTGLVLGGLLSLLNLHWMRNSVAAAFKVLSFGAKPELRLVQYFLRYLVIAATVVVAYNLNVISLPAAILGLCTFVVALFVEAFREFYFTIIHREEIG
jgi:hypothetical protein